nr:hypothetical protein [Candidatus Hakubella thermalkaliphila]
MSQQFLDGPDIVPGLQQEQKRRKGLILRRSSDLLLNSQIGQEGVDLRFSHLGRMAHVVEVDKPLDPEAIGLLSPAAVVLRTQCFAKLVQQFRPGIAHR